MRGFLVTILIFFITATPVFAKNYRVEGNVFRYTGFTKYIRTYDMDSESQEERFLKLVNEARQRRGLYPLVKRWDLMEGADAKAQKIKECGVFTHFPCGHHHIDYYRDSWENITYQASKWNEVQAFQSQFNSTLGHRETLLSEECEYAGVGVITDQSMFGRKGQSLYVFHCY